MLLIYSLCAMLFGTIIGSFLNVVIYRYNSGSGLGGRSHCFSCSRILLWFDLVPLVSYIVLRGRCRGCKSVISLQYPFVELTVGLLFAFTLYHELYPSYLSSGTLVSITPWLHIVSRIAYLYIVESILVVIFMYDLRHKIIPNGLVYAFAIITLASAIALFIYDLTFNTQFWLTFSSGFILAVPFALLWLLSRGRLMGLGDAKLALGIGWFLGLVLGASAIVMAFWLGAIFSIIVLILRQISANLQNISTPLSAFVNNVTIKSEIPFAPFLIVGLFIEYFFEFDVLGLSYFTNYFF